MNAGRDPEDDARESGSILNYRAPRTKPRRDAWDIFYWVVLAAGILVILFYAVAVLSIDD